MVEFLIILPVLLFIILATLQFAFIYRAKITLNYATFEAARAGSLNSARQYAMNNAMARALAPIYTTEDSITAYKTAMRSITRTASRHRYASPQNVATAISRRSAGTMR